MDATAHIPVLLDEVVGVLSPGPGQVYLDCTAGLGGHAALVASRVGPGGTVIINDLDAGNLTRAEARVRDVIDAAGAGAVEVVPIQGNFADLPRDLASRGLIADMVLADLGFASNQVDDASRGLSFRAEGPLDMRLDESLAFTAAELLETLPEAELADLIWRYGEDRHAKRIAQKLVEERRHGPMTTTTRLAEVIRSACPAPSRRRDGGRGIDAATRTFQALRIAVNDEIGSLESFLSALRRGADMAPSGGGWLAPGARVSIISFHSLEDRPVKRAFADMVERDLVKALTRGVVTPGEAEVARNPRARSAKMRAVRLGA